MPSEEHAKECLEKKLDGEGEPVSVVSLRKTGGSGSDVPGFLPGLRQKVYIMNCEAVLEFTKDGRCRTIRGTGWGAERGAVDGKKGQRTTVGGELSFFKVNGAWDARQLINLSVIDTKAKDDHR